MKTKLFQLQIYDLMLKALRYHGQAHSLSLLLIGFAFTVSFLLYSNPKNAKKNSTMSGGLIMTAWILLLTLCIVRIKHSEKARLVFILDVDFKYQASVYRIIWPDLDRVKRHYTVVFRD